jgi:hypothetical protein
MQCDVNHDPVIHSGPSAGADPRKLFEEEKNKGITHSAPADVQFFLATLPFLIFPFFHLIYAPFHAGSIKLIS